MNTLRGFCTNLVLAGLFLVITSAGTAWAEASYLSGGIIYLSRVTISGDGTYEAFLKAADRNGQEFDLLSTTLVTSELPADATYDSATGELRIQDLTLYISGNHRDHMSVVMLRLPDTNPVRFRVTSVTALNLPYEPEEGSSRSSTVSGIIRADGTIIQGTGFTVSQPDYGLYAVDFGSGTAGYVCTCTLAIEDILSLKKLYRPNLGTACIIVMGDPVGGNSHSVLFSFPDISSGFQFICVRS